MDHPDPEFEFHAENWTRLALDAPYWVVLSQPGAEDADWDEEQFFELGRGFGVWLTGLFGEIGIEPVRQRALDFGCGLGRLTQMLASFFAEVHGVDVAQPMVEAARRFNRHGERCHYHHNERLDLELFEDASFDFVISTLVLQHMRPDFMRCYLREFMRVLRPGGVLFFQVPIAPIIPVDPLPEVAPVAPVDAGGFDLSLRIRPRTLNSQAGVVRDVQVIVRNECARDLPPGIGLRVRCLAAATAVEMPGTATVR